MEKKEVTIGKPLTVAGLTLIPVSEVTINHWHGKRGIACSGIKQALSIIVVTPSAKRAFHLTGEEVSLDQLAQEIPGIWQTLEEIESGSY